jgi:hypothetical protein
MKLHIIASALVLMGGWAVGVAASDMDVDGGGLLEEEMAREFQEKRMLAERAEVSNLMVCLLRFFLYFGGFGLFWAKGRLHTGGGR